MTDDHSETRVDLSQILVTDPGVLAELMDVNVGRERLWHPEELAAVFEHHLSSPIEFELNNLGREQAFKLQTLGAAQGLLLNSLSDLLLHPRPPVELLRMTKEYSKACTVHPDSPLPPEVASAIYFTSIIVARLRCCERISNVGEEYLRRNLISLIAQPWITDPIRSLLREGLRSLGR